MSNDTVDTHTATATPRRASDTDTRGTAGTVTGTVITIRSTAVQTADHALQLESTEVATDIVGQILMRFPGDHRRRGVAKRRVAPHRHLARPLLKLPQRRSGLPLPC